MKINYSTNKLFYAVIATLLWGALSACSVVKVTYNYADTFVYQWLDTYLDFSGPQEPLMKDRLAQILQWHRKQELPEYARLLQSVRSKTQPTVVQPSVSTEDVLQLQREIVTRAQVLAVHCLPDLIDYAMTIKSEQVINLQKKFDAENKKFRKEHLHADLEARAEKRLKHARERYEFWLGDLNPKQITLLQQFSQNTPNSMESRYVDRLRHQNDIMVLLKRVVKDQPNKETIKNWLLQYQQSFENNPDARVRQQLEQSNQANAQLTAQLFNLSTNEQKQTFNTKLNGWLSDIQLLMSGK